MDGGSVTLRSGEEAKFREQVVFLEEVQRATVNILEDFEIEKARLAETERATFNILEDFDQERARSQEFKRATFNLLEDFEREKVTADETQRAAFNILEDFESEKSRAEATQQATFNILEDFEGEKSRLEDAQRASLNILEDLDLEKARVEHAERELANRADELARSNRDLEQFAYVASHDLQEPLRTVFGAVSRLAKAHKGTLGSDSDELIEFALKGAERMKSLVQDLLTFSRVGTQVALLVPVDADAILDQTLVVMEETISQSGSRIRRTPLPQVRGDSSQLVQLFQNLIGNGIKFRGAGSPRIEVGAVGEGPMWRFHVRDNGIGIPPEGLPKLFVIFQRLQTREQYAGTGVGLAICKRIVERHGGRIWVESEVGKGSTFYFTLAGAGMGESL